eukprot:g78.t1
MTEKNTLDAWKTLLAVDFAKKSLGHVSAQMGHVDIVVFLLNQKRQGRIIPPDYFSWKNVFGQTAVQMASARQQVIVVEALVADEVCNMTPASDIAVRRLFDYFYLPLREREGFDERHGFVSLSRDMVLGVLKSVWSSKGHVLEVALRMSVVLDQAGVDAEVCEFASDCCIAILDSCLNKAQFKAILAPLRRGDPEPVGIALDAKHREVLSHDGVQTVFFERWDPEGLSAFAGDARVLTFCMIGSVILWLLQLVLLSWLAIVREFSPSVWRFSLRGERVADMRFPYHIPMVVYLFIFIEYLVFLLLYTWSAWQLDASFSIVETLLTVWAAAYGFRLVGSSFYGLVSADSFIVAGILVSLAFRYHLLIVDGDNAQFIRTTDIIEGVTIIVMLATILRFASVNPSFGSLIIVWKQLISTDVMRVFVCAAVLFVAFALGVTVMFRHPCVDAGECADNVNAPDVKQLALAVFGQGTIALGDSIGVVVILLFLAVFL